MGKHDARSHLLHIPKAQKFKAQKPALSQDPKTNNAPQQPKIGTNSFNQYR